jgi:hypothetical protein
MATMEKKTNGRSSIRHATSSPTALGSERFLIPPTLQLLRDSEIKQTKMRLNDNRAGEMSSWVGKTLCE